MSIEAYPWWLQSEFEARGCRDVRLVRIGSSQVWGSASKNLIAKVYPLLSRELAEKEMMVTAAAKAGGAPVPELLGFTIHGEFAVSWWRREEATQDVDNPVEVAKILRDLHDRAQITGLPPMDPFIQISTPAIGLAPSELLEKLGPMEVSAREAWDRIVSLPQVVLHGDPNPTNVLRRDFDGSLVLVDFGAGGAGPRVFDVAVLCVLARETGSATEGDILAAYGEHQDVSADELKDAMEVVAYQRTEVCSRVYGWEQEGWDRLRSWQTGTSYVFGAGGHPK